MRMWKQWMAGGLVAVAMVAGGTAVASAQEPASLTGNVSLCSHDLTSCEIVEGLEVYFDINGSGNEQVVLTDANGDASLEVATGDVVSISVDPDAIPGATISPESQAGFVVDPVVGNENSFEFVFIENEDTTTVLPNSGSGWQLADGNGSDTLVFGMAAGALSLAAGGYVLARRHGSQAN